ncbi:MAG: sugar phosphate isomerase/epimerase [Firmicutes bacterium]|nr:sugar phosphate isomerase/epimerase [Bacillota bacterium]
MHEIKIGTIVPAGNAKKMIPRLIPYGFETFALMFWESIGKTDVQQLATDVMALLEGTGCTISSIGVYGNPLLDNERGENCRKSWEALINAARLFKTDIVAGFTGRVLDASVDKSIPKFTEVFTPLTELAREKGVKIAFENCDMGGDWNRGDFNIAFSPKAWELMFEAVPYDNIGLQWEPCHHMVQLVDPIPQLRKWVHRIFSIHGKDATIAWDVIKEKGIKCGEPYAWHRTPGFGDSNWTDIISILRMAGYKGAIEIEGWHDPIYKGELEYVGQVHALNYLKNCRGGDWVPNLEA